MIGVAAALIVMTASAGPAQALFGVNLPSRQQGAPTRLTKMPESVYVRREELQDFVSFCRRHKRAVGMVHASMRALTLVGLWGCSFPGGVSRDARTFPGRTRQLLCPELRLLVSFFLFLFLSRKLRFCLDVATTVHKL